MFYRHFGVTEMRTRRVAVAMLFAFVGACSGNGLTAPPPGLRHAVATPFCAPNDGPAVALYLSDAATTSLPPSVPYLRVGVWQPLAALSGETWSVAPDDGEGGAWLHSEPATFEIASGGTVSVRSVTADGDVIGTLDIIFPDRRRIKGDFTAKWIAGRPICG